MQIFLFNHRYLAHGGNAYLISQLFYIGYSTTYEIIHTVCKVIWEELQPIYLKKPNIDDWREISEEYEIHCNFPNCVGCLDGIHIAVTCPPHSGSLFFNYKKFYSFVLLAVCDSLKRFTIISLGHFGKFNFSRYMDPFFITRTICLFHFLGTLSDSSIFLKTKFYEDLIAGNLNLPESKRLPNSNLKTPFVFLGDEIFPTITNLMTPYPRRHHLSYFEKIFNYRLSRARWTIECSFGELVSKFTILKTTLNMSLKNSKILVGSVVCLHNFIIAENLENSIGAKEMFHYDPVFNKNFRQNNEHCNTPLLNRNQHLTNGVYNRRIFTKYFVNEGSVPWQDTYI